MEVNNDFGDDDGNFAMPIADDQSALGRQTNVSTFNYAQDSTPAFLKGVPSDLVQKQGREATLGSNVVAFSSKGRLGTGFSTKSELI